MIAEIITIGDELLIGQITNTNASYIAGEMNLAGIRVKRITTIGDTRDEILLALKRANEYAELIIITGGLGPTNDDITKKTLCDFFETKLVLHKESLDSITKLFKSRGWDLTERNRQQAMLPYACRPIKNTVGTAPGMWFEKRRIHTISLPGVPFEMKKMMTDEVLPQLKSLSISMSIVHRTILTMGIGESSLADRIKDWEDALPSAIRLAYLPEVGIVKLRLSCYTAGAANAQQIIDEAVAKLKELIPDLIFGYGKDTIQQVTGNLLKQHHKTVCTAESCTGGYIAHLITSVPGSSEYFMGSVVAYDNNVKIKSLGVDTKLIAMYGAVSREVVEAMAAGALSLMNTDYAIATSGIAGPEGGTDEKPLGTTWIALATAGGIQSEMFLLGDDRERNIRRAALIALNMLRKEIQLAIEN
jgi:nicotinamide-nucleotide amidase